MQRLDPALRLLHLILSEFEVNLGFSEAYKQ
jgi:hypothetical protein